MFSLNNILEKIQQPLAPGLYIVATPIGNLGDITLRALHTLAAADVVAAEDTRTALKLCRLYGFIPQKIISYHDHSDIAAEEECLQWLRNGKIVALMSEAGTPLINDPGFTLVRRAREQGLPVWGIPGASALLTALSVAGLPTDKFTFVGFMPRTEKARRDLWPPTRGQTAVAFESPKRLRATLEQMQSDIPTAQVVVARELTKLYEQVDMGSPADMLFKYPNAPKGEIVLLWHMLDTPMDEADARMLLSRLLETNTLKQAVEQVHHQTGLSKKKVYAWALDIRKA
jgi:16S rRNA (cytidine1402-2'-O)-methyltransferase